ncbi:MAG: hypothetical protein ONB12_03770 [candidate division KSB1 bacterium]|nr:hypothetical protein [candidate division KSB1 bacterium]
MKKIFIASLIVSQWTFSRAQEGIWESLAARWNVLLPVETYSAENLHEYINGAADLFRAYDVVEAVTATFFLPPDSSHCFTVDLYRFAEPLDAFGLYARQAASGTRLLLGNEAAVSSMSIKLWQNEYYVLLTACSADSAVQQALLQAAETISAALPPPIEPLEFSLLPEKDRIPHSLAYYRRSYPRVDGLERVLEARYRSKEQEKLLILVRCRDEAEREQALTLIRKAGARARPSKGCCSVLAELHPTE